MRAKCEYFDSNFPERKVFVESNGCDADVEFITGFSGFYEYRGGVVENAGDHVFGFVNKKLRSEILSGGVVRTYEPESIWMELSANAGYVYNIDETRSFAFTIFEE